MMNRLVWVLAITSLWVVGCSATAAVPPTDVPNVPSSLSPTPVPTETSATTTALPTETTAPAPTSISTPVATASSTPPSAIPPSPAATATHPSAGTSGPITTPSSVVPTQAQPAVNAAIKDLAGQVQAPVSTIGVASVTNATWPDGALGCPKPGMAYSQIVRPGYRIILTYSGRSYEYHSDRGTTIVSCSSP